MWTGKEASLGHVGPSRRAAGSPLAPAATLIPGAPVIAAAIGVAGPFWTWSLVGHGLRTAADTPSRGRDRGGRSEHW